MRIEQNYNGWVIVIARHTGGQMSYNAYTDTIPVRQLTADTLKDLKALIDEEEL